MNAETLPVVLEYLTAETTATVRLPKSRPVCKYCVAWLRYERDFDRYSCRLTGELLFDVAKTVGLMCPIRRKQDESGIV